MSRDEMEFDRTRNAIGSESLEGQDRQDMLKKFTGAGGKVLDEKSKHDKQSGGSAGRGGAGSGSDTRLPSELAREERRLQAEKEANIRQQLIAEESAATGFTSRFMIKFKCKMSGLTPFGQDMVTPRFMSRLNLDAKRAIMECNILGNDLLMTNAETGKRIVKELDKLNPLYLELIDRASRLYMQSELGEITSSYSANPSSSTPLDAIRAPLFPFIRRLYYLKAYQSTYLNAVDIAINIQQQVEKKQPALYASKRKKIHADWKTLMDQIFPSLILLVQRSEMTRAELGTRLLEKILGVENEDRLGHRSTGDPIGVAAELDLEPDEETLAEFAADDMDDAAEPASIAADDMLGDPDETSASEPASAPAPVGSNDFLTGVELMQTLSIQELRKRHDVKSETKDLMPDTDKVLISYLFLKEFEEEYSIILTTPRVKINPTFRSGLKVDHRQLMADVYEETRPCYEVFKQYIHETDEYRRVMAEAATHANQNYVKFAKRISQLEHRRGGTGRQVRIAVKEYMQKIQGIMTSLLQDMDGAKKIILNPDEALKFDKAIEGTHRLDGKSVKTSIHELFCYSMALQDRLESGDLFGGVIEMSEDEYQESFG